MLNDLTGFDFVFGLIGYSELFDILKFIVDANVIPVGDYWYAYWGLRL